MLHTTKPFVIAQFKTFRILKQKRKNPGNIAITELLTFVIANTFLQLNPVFIANNRTGFRS